MKIKGEIQDLKIKRCLKKRRRKNKQIKKNDCKNSKIYLGLSLVLWAVWGQFIFGQFPDPAYTSQDLQAPSYVVGTNYRVLIYCTCHFQGGSLHFSFCLLVSSVSVFHPDTRRAVVDTFFQAHLFNHAVGREGCCKQITLACAHSVSATLGLPPLTVHVLSLPTLLRLQFAPLGTV